MMYNNIMLIDTDFIFKKYSYITVDILMRLLNCPHFEKKIELIDKRFDLNFFNKTYAFDFTDYDDAYAAWKELKKHGYKGFALIKNDVRYYLQLSQDYIIINELYKKCTGGTFVDINAGNGMFNNNTYALEKYFGWSGLIIESDHTIYEELTKNRKSKCIIKNTSLDSLLNDISLRNCADVAQRENFSNIHYFSINACFNKSTYDILNEITFNKKYKIYCMSLQHVYLNLNDPHA